jgi:hypothetical protein
MKRLDTAVGSRFESDLKSLLTKMKKQDLLSSADNSLSATILSEETMLSGRLKR